MGVPDYFGRNAVAIAQAISGLDDERLKKDLSEVRVGVTLGRDATRKEARALTDMLVRLIARLYPVLLFRSEESRRVCDDALGLARRINPSVDLEGDPTIELVVGSTRLRPWAPQRVFVGSSAWTGSISTRKMQRCADTAIPFGAGVAACLAAANLFRSVFVPGSPLDEDATFDALEHTDVRGATRKVLPALDGAMVLAGCGAIGNAAAWALSRVPLTGGITLVDHQCIDLGNLQRYVLAERSDEGQPKPDVAARYFDECARAVPFAGDLAAYLERHHHRIERLLLALDSAQDRRAAQASLPGWVANAWTQPGDLGVSTHDFETGACVSCLYLPDRPVMNEDAVIAESFGVPSRAMEIRVLLHRRAGAPRSLLEAIAAARDIPLERLLPFEGRPVRSLYVDGFCGGAVLPLSRIGPPRTEVHVPLAHQSAFAGILLAAAATRHQMGLIDGSQITQVDVLKPLPPSRTRPAAKDPRGICICQDPDYQERYRSKFAGTPTRSSAQATPKKSKRPARHRGPRTRRRGRRT